MKLSNVAVLSLAIMFSQNAHGLPGREPQPKLYPNKHLSEVGETKARQDIGECTDAAAAYVHNSRQPGQGAKKALGNATKGALLGTVGGAIRGNTGRGAAAGSVVGVTRGAMKGIQERGSGNPAFQQFVTACLEDKGYKVLGWS